ncbi:MAG: TonB-dependent receptor [Flavobacteriaceae bacterium]|nr:TonB-dependent receptor [Flavobacteriaceae bacterium]
MKKYIFIVCISWGVVFSQDPLNGIVQYQENNKTYPLTGASVFWQNTTIGTVTGQNGTFQLERTPETDLLIISYVGFKTDTLKIQTPFITHQMIQNQDDELDEVTLTQRRKASQKSFIETQNILKVSSEELLKAACCNLSESFETNPAIDVNFADALTGTKQIKMLGLSSPYLMISEENIPMVRGASQAYGLTFTPGTWVESIQISKGAGSVTNGFESIAGQINTELKKPLTDIPFFLNLFGSINGRYEMNTHFNHKIDKNWSTGLYLHGNKRTQKFDNNNDGFLDLPVSEQINVMNRWQYTDMEKGWVSFLSWRYMNDDKLSGTLNFNPEIDRGMKNRWGSEIKTKRLDASFKLGYVFPETPYQSFGFQTAYSSHDQDSYYGLRIYDINQHSFYTNLIFNSIIGNTLNKFKVGLNYSFDDYVEQVDGDLFGRTDRNVGSFFEFTHDNNDNFSWIAGIRVDFHNNFGSFLTPRIHFRYVPLEDLVIRLSAGSGRKAANIFAENQTLFATNRAINIQSSQGKIYGLHPEKAWNYGLGLSKSFYIRDPHQITLSADYYTTHFTDQVVVDWEKSRQISFYNLEGRSYAKSFQLELDYYYRNFLNFRAAYKNYDVQVDYKSGLMQKPLLAKNRFFANLGWESKTSSSGKQWRYDLTHHYVGAQRLVSNLIDNPRGYSPNYSLWNTQLTRVFSKKFEVYLGGENIGNYRQSSPIIGSDDSFGADFDAAQIYAPIFGAMVYSGLRLKI